MAKIFVLKQDAFEKWVSERPPVVQEMIRKYPPDRLYWLSPPGQRVTLTSYNENGKVTVEVTGQWNAVVFDRKVFGVDPANLTECDLPQQGEPLGTLLTDNGDIWEYSHQWHHQPHPHCPKCK